MKFLKSVLVLTVCLFAGLLLAASPAEAKRAKDFNDAQIKLLFSGTEVAGEGSCVISNIGVLTLDFTFHKDGRFFVDYDCTQTTGAGDAGNTTGTWSIAKNELCMVFKYPGQGWQNDIQGNCYSVRHDRSGFGFYSRAGRFLGLTFKHHRFPSKEKLLAALDEKDARTQKVLEKKKEDAARREAEELKRKKETEEKRRQQEMAEAAKRQEIERKLKTAGAKKQKEAQARKAAARAKAKAEEEKAREIVKPKMAAISDTLKTCLSSSSIQTDQLEAKITALNQQVSCYDTALKEIGVLKTPVKRVQANINKQMKAISSKRQGLTRVLAQKQTKAKQIATAAAKRREEVKRKRKELVQRKKLAGTSDLFKGDARDFVFMANLSSENVTLGLSGQPTFLKSPIPTCYVTPTKIDVDGDEFTADAVGLAKVKTKSNLSFKPCGDLDTETSDLIVFRRGIIGNANISTLNKLVSAQKDGVMSQFFVAEVAVFDGRKLAEKKAVVEAEKQKQATIARITEEVLSGKREGFGFVVADPSSSVVCIETGDTRLGAARIVTKKELGAPDHIAERPVTVKEASLEKTYINMKLKKCGTVFANAKSLAMIYKALKRDKINAEFAHVWVDGKTLKAAGEKGAKEAKREKAMRKADQLQRKQAAREQAEGERIEQEKKRQNYVKVQESYWGFDTSFAPACAGKMGWVFTNNGVQLIKNGNVQNNPIFNGVVKLVNKNTWTIRRTIKPNPAAGVYKMCRNLTPSDVGDTVFMSTYSLVNDNEIFKNVVETGADLEDLMKCRVRRRSKTTNRTYKKCGFLSNR